MTGPGFGSSGKAAMRAIRTPFSLDAWPKKLLKLETTGGIDDEA